MPLVSEHCSRTSPARRPPSNVPKATRSNVLARRGASIAKENDLSGIERSELAPPRWSTWDILFLNFSLSISSPSTVYHNVKTKFDISQTSVQLEVDLCLQCLALPSRLWFVVRCFVCGVLDLLSVFVAFRVGFVPYRISFVLYDAGFVPYRIGLLVLYLTNPSPLVGMI